MAVAPNKVPEISDVTKAKADALEVKIDRNLTQGQRTMSISGYVESKVESELRRRYQKVGWKDIHMQNNSGDQRDGSYITVTLISHPPIDTQAVGW